MAEPFIGEIRITPYTFSPRDFAYCDGQLVPISQNSTLYAVIGTTYGGNGTTSMGLPNLKGRAPMHSGQAPGLSYRPIGYPGGVNQVALDQTQLPAHTHEVTGINKAGDSHSGAGNYLAIDTNINVRVRNLNAAPTGLQDMSSATLQVAGASAAHENRQPFLVMPFCIALMGLFPSRN
ncbi:phage tail protein [Photobacterium alginatilyticum]|uniref:Phage tail protein n=1 Tax=Photobacterium alginatilyticum TaxID=1775171 RepID=A0ABW9YQD2_9GAMM|nr:tail fiber protein [Photobacterium alginatilyticum]NBI56153.1 phage tail protein [Photobacterium alginatilyticum]